MVACPLELLLEEIYSRLSIPFIFCSMIDVTVFCNVSAEAPEYDALIDMDGGATLGYWATGSCVIAKPPNSMISKETTQAKIGRSMKNLTIAVFSISLGLKA